VGVGATNALVVNNAGFIGIGTNAPAYTLDVSGVIRSNNLPKYWNCFRLFGSTYGIINTTNDVYFLIGTLGDWTKTDNAGAINIKGTIGGWSNPDKSVIDITITSRGATATTIGVLGNMNSSTALSNCLGFNDFVAYYQGGTGSSSGAQYNIYYKVKLNTFTFFDFTVIGNDFNSNSSTLSEPTTAYTTTPTGTLLSGTPSILSSLQQYVGAGKVGIGITNPSQALDVSGTISMNSMKFPSSVSNLSNPFKIVVGKITMTNPNANSVSNKLGAYYSLDGSSTNSYTFSSAPYVTATISSGINGECVSMMVVPLATTMDIYIKNNSTTVNVTGTTTVTFIAIGTV
jgi:hypothetical protein